MKYRRIKLVWGAAKIIRGRWFFGLFGFYDRLEGKREDGLAISVRGALVWAAGVGLAAYLAGTMALFSFWQRNPYCLLTYGDAFFYPVRRGEVAAKKGQALIAEGGDLVKSNKWFDAARLIRQGLTLYPGDLTGRLTLAKYYALVNQRPTAVAVLVEGLTAEYPGRSYLQSLCDIAEQGEDYDLVVSMANRFRPRLAGDEWRRERRWLATRQFAALLAARKTAEALYFAQAEEPGDLAAEHRVLALLELGRAADAVDFLAEWRGRPGADLSMVRRLQVRAFREAGKVAEMERALAEMRAENPSDPRPAVYGVVQRALASDAAAAKSAFDDYLFRFDGSAANLQLVAEPLAEIGNLPLLERCVAAAAERGYPAQPFRVLHVQVRLQRAEWAETAALLALMKPVAGRALSPSDQIWWEWMNRLTAAAASTQETAQSALVEFLRGRPWPVKVFRRSIETLRRAGRTETARDVLGFAEAAFPASRWLQTQRAEVALELAAKRPAEVAATAASSRPAGERAFFQQLDEQVRALQWEAAEKTIRDVRASRPPPDWLERRDAEVRLAEVRLNQARGEVPAMLVAARVYLNGDAERSRVMTEIAQGFYGSGDQAGAIALLQAILRQTPEQVQAQRLLKEWKPRPPAPK